MSEYEAILHYYSNQESLQWSEDDVNIIIFVGWLWIGRVDLSVDPSCADDKDIRVIKIVQGALEVSLVRNIHPCSFLSGMHEIPPFEIAMLCWTGIPSFPSNHSPSLQDCSMSC